MTPPPNQRPIGNLAGSIPGHLGNADSTPFGPPPPPGPGRALPKRVRLIREARQQLVAKQYKEAVEILRPLRDQKKPDAEALFLTGVAYEGLKNFKSALFHARQSVREREHPDALMLVARLETRIGDTEAAVRACEKVLAQRPGLLVAQTLMAGAYETGGQFEESRRVLEPIVRDYEARAEELPGLVATEWAKVLVQAKDYDGAIARINALMPTLPDEESKRYFLHLQAKACDRKKDYAGAWDAASKAGVIHKTPFDPALYADQVSTLINIWNAGDLAAFPRARCDSEVPVFVAGMPRSGTSLIDQIIDAHPKAAGVGELATIEKFALELSKEYDPSKPAPECFGPLQEPKWTRMARDYVRHVSRRAPGAQRVVNKSLGNNKMVGLLARLFPKTKIIHAVRDPRDVAISCFMGGFNNNTHGYTTEVAWTAYTWAQSVRMMHHWKTVLDVPVLDVHYERLVADPEHEFPRIIEFLGLEWDDACREFHKSRRTVRTLSYDQVNRPIYTSSSGRNANYAEWIAEINFPPYDPAAEDPLAGVLEWLDETPPPPGADPALFESQAEAVQQAAQQPAEPQPAPEEPEP